MQLTFCHLLVIWLWGWWLFHDIACLMFGTTRTLAHIRQTQIRSSHQLVHPGCWRRASFRALLRCVTSITRTEFIHQWNFSHNRDIPCLFTRIWRLYTLRWSRPSRPTITPWFSWVVRYMTAIEVFVFSFASPAVTFPTSLLAFVPICTELLMP